MARAVLAAIALLASCAVSSGYIYTYHEKFDDEVNAKWFSEGPMFAPYSAPFGNGNSYIRVASTFTQEVTNTSASNWPMVNVVFLDQFNMEAVGFSRYEAFVEPLVAVHCCTAPRYGRGNCDASTHGQVIIDNGAITTGATKFPSQRSFAFKTGVSETTVQRSVEEAGVQYVLIAVCGGDDQARWADLEIKFRNPYGYLPGAQYGYLPFYGVMFVLYVLVACVFSVVMAYNKEFIIKLQYAVFFVMVAGAIETGAWFFTYYGKNRSGVPLCCPATPDVIIAILFNVLKRGISRGLLLAVCLGFGVVQATLSKVTSFRVILLTSLFIIASANYDLQVILEVDPVSTSLWQLPLVAVDFTFIIAIYASLVTTKKSLEDSNQMVKLEMYEKLTITLKTLIMGVFVMYFVQVLTMLRIVPVPWRALWLFTGYWDILYFLVLVVIGIVWRPSEQSFQYVWYAQGLDDDDGGVEMTGPPGHLDDEDDDGFGGGGGGGTGGEGTSRPAHGGPGAVAVAAPEEPKEPPSEDAFGLGESGSEDDEGDGDAELAAHGGPDGEGGEVVITFESEEEEEGTPARKPKDKGD